MFRSRARHRRDTPVARRVTAVLLSATAATLGFMVATSATGVTSALWNSSTAVSNITVTSGSLGLTVNGGATAALSGVSWSKLLPGDVVSQQVTVVNTSTMATTVSARTTGSFGSTLVTIAKGSCGATLTGTSSTVSATSLGTFAAGESSIVCVQASLPGTAAASAQGAAASFTVTFSAAVGSWNASAAATSTSSVAALQVATSNFTSNAYTFRNDTLVTTGSVTVTNSTDTTSSSAAALSLAFSSAGGSTVLPGLLSLAIWPSSAGSCAAATATPATAQTGTWAAPPAVTTSLTAGATATYCLRSSAASKEALATTAGAMTFQPLVTATLSTGAFVATATASTTQAVQYVYPSFIPNSTGWYWIMLQGAWAGTCLDVSGAGGTGTALLNWGCSAAVNQQFQFAATTAGNLTIAPRHAPTLRADNNASTADGTGLVVNTANSALSQQWQLQLVTPALSQTSTYQVVSRQSGLCLTPASNYQILQKVCSGAPEQLVRVGLVAPITLSCANYQAGTANQGVTYSWSPAISSTLSFQATQTAGGTTWVQIGGGTAAANATSFVANGVATWPVGTYDVRAVSGAGVIQAVTTVQVVSGLNGTKYLAC